MTAITDEQFTREWIAKLDGTIRIPQSATGFADGIMLVIPDFLGKGQYRKAASTWKEAADIIHLLENVSHWYDQPEWTHAI